MHRTTAWLAERQAGRPLGSIEIHRFQLERFRINSNAETFTLQRKGRGRENNDGVVAAAWQFVRMMMQTLPHRFGYIMVPGTMNGGRRQCTRGGNLQKRFHLTIHFHRNAPGDVMGMTGYAPVVRALDLAHSSEALERHQH